MVAYLRKTVKRVRDYALGNRPRTVTESHSQPALCHSRIALPDHARPHGRVHRIPMNPPAWTPNKPDSIFTKMNQVIGGEHNSFF